MSAGWGVRAWSRLRRWVPSANAVSAVKARKRRVNSWASIALSWEVWGCLVAAG